MVQIIELNEAKHRLDELVDQAANISLTTYISYEGDPKVALINAREYIMTQETINVLSSRSTKNALKSGKNEALNGQTISLKKVKKQLNLE